MSDGSRWDDRNTILQGSVPKRVKTIECLLQGIQVLAPELPNVGVVVGFRVACPAQQGFLRRPRLKQRRDQRLRQTENRRHRFCVAPGLQEVMVGTNRMHTRAGFVRPVRERDRKGHFVQTLEKVL